MSLNIMFIAYYFDETDGVGALRSRALFNLLKKEKYKVGYFDKNSFKRNDRLFFWTLKLLIYILKEKPKNIYVSCGPYIHLFPLSIISKLLGVNLIVDFRDPWSLNIKTGYGEAKIRLLNKIKGKVAEYVEKRTYRTCKYFIVCTRGMKVEYKKIFKDDSKIILITNGHNIKNQKINKDLDLNRDILDFVCIGKFAEYNLSKAVQSLRKLNNFCEVNNTDYRIHFIGSDTYINQKAMKKAEINRNKVIFYHKKPYNEAISTASNFDIGLCNVRNEDFEYGTKIFDYIGLGLPIIGDFDKRRNFYHYFKPYIIEDEIPKISNKSKSKFLRENIFKKHLFIFEEE